MRPKLLAASVISAGLLAAACGGAAPVSSADPAAPGAHEVTPAAGRAEGSGTVIQSVLAVARTAPAELAGWAVGSG